MGPTVRDLIHILQIFFPPELSLHRALYLLGVILSVYPLFLLHINQRRQPGQRIRTAWLTSIEKLFKKALAEQDEDNPVWTTGIDRSTEYSEILSNDLAPLYNLLGAAPGIPENPVASQITLPIQRIVLVTSHLSCIFCPPADLNIIPTLRRQEKAQIVWLLDEDLRWVEADLLIAHCASCKADYYPDCVTFRDENNRRCQKLDSSPPYLRVSKQGIWVHRRVAVLQESAVDNLHAGWSSFAALVNGTASKSTRKLTVRQSQRLWTEHFARRLLLFHSKLESFTCRAHPSTRTLATAVRTALGENGGVLSPAMSHGCTDCTHLKRFRSDLVAEGAVFGASHQLTDTVNTDEAPDLDPAADPAVAQLPLPQQQQPPVEGQPRGYVRMAVMDGKNIPHRKCTLDVCEGPLVNYRDGRFCAIHMPLTNRCGILSCNREIQHAGSLTCDDPAHVAWYKQYKSRFRLSFPGVQRVIRRQQEHGVPAPSTGVRNELSPLGDIPGEQVVHSFDAGSTYCLQTVQWACGYPIGWGKCYRSESSSQVLAILDRIWANHPESKPAFIAYDDACSLLRHIVTQDPHSPWLERTKFIVDAFHYIGHLVTDLLCRLWCNPQPLNGSQPDLVRVETDSNGNTHQTRAFNTQTAEQLNSWLNGFESQLRQMSDVNYDLVVHVLMLLYAEKTQRRVGEDKLELTEEFWSQALGVEGEE
ncbi:hypothetical protein R3P38DRAFT_2598194 [Favolaschia claudopus]|uniref:CxC5 like cysteine cluster associated with KDZ domain-containing protein n=1 Tax=Favolaschia claudopus TaxID=2862362 RepID=A0AAW0E7Z6_9AGAR